jgi:glyoxylase-like metal-dependent hydrolase (beta-lactamase superfamily II)
MTQKKTAPALKAILLTLTLSAATVFAQDSAGTLHGPLQGADHYTFRVGDIDVTALSDGTVPQDLHALLRNTTAQKTDALLHDAFLSNPAEVSITAFLFRDAGHTVLVDTGAGELFGPGYGAKLVESLASIQVSPADITDVLITHAHSDHMGGLIHDGQLVFPNAIVHLAAADLNFFLDRSNAEKTKYPVSYFDQAISVFKPEQAADKIKAFSSDGEVLPDVEAVIHPGHTPGSSFYILHSHGQSVTFIGDIVHVAAVQAPDPEITITYDVDPVKAAAVRKVAFAEFAKDRTLIASPHLPFPGVGHLKANGKGYIWMPLVYRNRASGGDEVSSDSQ